MTFEKIADDLVHDLQDRHLLHNQLAEYVKGVTSSAIGNIVNAVIMLGLFIAVVSPAILFACATILLSMSYIRLRHKRDLPSADADMTLLSAYSNRINISALLMGLLWGSMIGGFFTVQDAEKHIFLGVLAAGMMGAASFSFRTRPLAARLYIVAMVPGVLFGFWSLHSWAGLAAICLTFCYVGVLVAHVGTGAKSFDLAVVREYRRKKAAAELKLTVARLKDSSETIQMLLSDYSSQGSDLIFDIDVQGAVVDPSLGLAEAFSRPLETLEGKKLRDLLDPSPELEALAEAARHHRPFRNQVVSLTIEGEKHWWSISGRPVMSDHISYRMCATDITARREAEEKVSYMAHYDALTDLPNRFHFGERMTRELHKSGAQSYIALLCLDLDNFKAINDTLGHPTGDKLLQHVAGRLKSCIAGRDLVARLGGDEFAILLTSARSRNVSAIAQRIVDSLAAPFQLGDHDVVTGASVGIAIAPDHGKSVDDLLRNADLALYEAKRLGRNRAITFEAGLDEAAQTRRIIEMDLRSSLGKNEMCLHYQPVVDAGHGETIGYEALIRWEHPEHGIVMPNVFIPIAEETGMILQIGEWVIRKAIDDLATWEDHLSVAINLSPAQMRSPTLISTVMVALASTSVDPGRICLEITETVLMQDSSANIETLHKLRSLGVQIALDDFGTGYSSLNYLRSFPFSKIKIDRCFVSEIDSRADCQAIVQSVVSLAESLGMKTTAEGVERQEQVDFLRASGCGELQGFLYSKAIPADELSNLRSPKALPLSKVLDFQPHAPHIIATASDWRKAS